MQIKNRDEFLKKFLERRKNLMEPVDNIIWDLTKDIEPRAQFRALVNFLFRNDPHAGKNNSYYVDWAIRKISNSHDVEGYEYILTMDQIISELVNKP